MTPGKAAAEAALAVAAFAGTNVDDVFVLLAFLSDSRYRAGEVVTGQFAGMAVLTFGSCLLASAAREVPTRHAALLGVVPLALGIKRILDLWKPARESPPRPPSAAASNVLTVAAATVANGGDNVGVYVPLFVTRSTASVGVDVVVFFAMTGVLCWSGLLLLRNRKLGDSVRRAAPYATPWVFIGLGLLVLLR